MAALEVDLGTIKEGNTVTVKWRGKPVFVKHRTDVEIAREAEVALSDLRDPETDEARTIDPKVSPHALVSPMLPSRSLHIVPLLPAHASRTFRSMPHFFRAVQPKVPLPLWLPPWPLATTERCAIIVSVRCACSGSSALASARTLAVSQLPTPAISTAGSARATAPTTMAAAVSAEALRRTTSRCPSTSSSRTASFSSAELHPFRRARVLVPRPRFSCAVRVACSRGYRRLWPNTRHPMAEAVPRAAAPRLARYRAMLLAAIVSVAVPLQDVRVKTRRCP